MTYSHEVLDNYLSLDAPCIRTLNNLYLVWNAYAIVILVKLHWLFQTSNSNFGADFVPALKTTHYLDAVGVYFLVDLNGWTWRLPTRQGLYGAPFSTSVQEILPAVPIQFLTCLQIQAKLTEVATDGQSPASEAFGFVFMKLKMWHRKSRSVAAK
jgi:hypothetical protein